MTPMLSQNQVDSFQRDGFLNSGPVLDEGELDALRDELDRVLAIGPEGFDGEARKPVSFRDLNSPAESGESENPVWQIVNIWEASPAFERLIYHPFVVKAISQLAGHRELMVWHDQIQYKPAEAGGQTGWHQDSPLWPIIKPLTPVSAWIPFDDADVENGCMWMVPGSHLWGDQIDFLREQRREFHELEDFGGLPDFEPPEQAGVDAVRAVPRPVKRREISFHHSLTWHGSPHNRSDRPRRAIAIHYMTGEAHYDASGDHLMKKFVEVEDGEPMAEAGPHFPTVCVDGEPVGVPARLTGA